MPFRPDSVERSYRDDRLSPRVRFDEVETTMSHLFRRPHPALGGRTYGEALYHALRARGALEVPRVIEVGAGAGFVAASMMAAAVNEARPLEYFLLDLSRTLLRAQRFRVPRAAGVVAHAGRLPFRDRSVRGLLLANEVIADLPVCAVTDPRAQEAAGRFGLTLHPTAPVNIGALELIEELSRALHPGARACLIEFGGDGPASPVRLEGPLGAGRHVEHAICFHHLEVAARALGLVSERLLLGELLGIDQAMRVSSYPDVFRLRRFVRDLPVLAYPKQELERRHPVLTRVFQLEFPAIGSPRFPDPRSRGGLCQVFQVLLLRAPRDESEAMPCGVMRGAP